MDVPEQTEGDDGDDGGAADSRIGDGPALARLGEQTAAASQHARAALGISQRRLADLLDRLGFSLSLWHYRWCARDSGGPSAQLHEPWAH